MSTHDDNDEPIQLHEHEQTCDDQAKHIDSVHHRHHKTAELKRQAELKGDDLFEENNVNNDKSDGNAAHGIIETAIHCKDVTVEKVQEIGHNMVETVHTFPGVAIHAVSLFSEKLNAAGHWAAEKATEVGSATIHSAQEAIHNLTGLAGDATEQTEGTTNDGEEEESNFKINTIKNKDVTDTGPNHENEIYSENNDHTSSKGSDHHM